MFSMGVFHLSDEALKGARKRRGKPRLDQHMRSNLEALQRSPPNQGRNKVARSGRKIEQNEVPKAGSPNRVTHGRTPIVCIGNRSQQDGHPAQRDEPAGAHTCVSFDFGFASRTEHEPKACGLFIHDRQVLCMWFQHRRREDDICSTSALSFVGFWFGLGNQQLLFDTTRSHQHFLCFKLLRKHADHLESESLKRQFLQEVMLRMVLQKSL